MFRLRRGEMMEFESKRQYEADELEFDETQAKIAVIGIGGAGNNCVTRLFDKGITGAETIAVNTDKVHLQISRAHRKVLIGYEVTKGLGAGGYPEIGRKCAIESKPAIKDLLKGIDMLFLTCGLGGGTGTGAEPVIAEVAREMGIIVISTVFWPFQYEGARLAKAEEGLYEFRRHSDTVIVIENDRIAEIAGRKPIREAFEIGDQLVANMIKAITETIALPSMVNLDYADVRAVMTSGGVAMIGVGESSSERRAEEAIKKALSSPLLDVSCEGATGALIHVTGGESLSLDEVNQIGQVVTKSLDPNAQVVWGARIDPSFDNKLRVMAIITGVKSPHILGTITERRRVLVPSPEKAKISQELGIDVL